MDIAQDRRLVDPDVIALLEAHLEDMRAITPPESVHALDLDALRAPDIRFWTARDDAGALMGCGALKRHNDSLGEIKSMRTGPDHRRMGVAAALLEHALSTARGDGLCTVKLETGSTDHFGPARALYAAYGFSPCGPFADYTDDPHSVYMEKNL
ncbi:MAG: GNAT family N-acetyltransferase [Pseudomonadota bacterium]